MQTDPSPAKILVVEDDREMAAMLRALLEPRGYPVRAAYDGLSGLAVAQADTFSLIILDLGLPGMNGDDFLAHLREDKRTAAVPVLVLTGRGDASQRVRLFELGVDDYLVKPASPLELLTRIQALLRQPRNGAADQQGKLIVFLGCAGGVGTTTICVNTAQALGSRAPTLVLDMSWPLGAVTHVLAMPAQAGLQEVLSDDITLDTLATYLAGGQAGLRFRYLNGFGSISATTCPHVDIAPLVRAARPLARYVLVDLGDSSAPFAPAVLGAADLVVLVTVPERTHIAHMRSYLQYLDHLGVRRSRRILVGNRLRPSPLAVREMQRSLGEEIFLMIPYESERFAQCMADGRLLLGQHPDSAAAIAITELASALSRKATAET